MELEKYTSADLFNLSQSPDVETRNNLWNLLVSDLQRGVSDPHFAYPNNIDSFIRKNVDLFFQHNGWYRCAYSGRFFPLDKLTVVFKSYRDFLRGAKSFVSTEAVNLIDLCFDAVEKCYFFDSSSFVFNENFESVRIAASHLSYKKETGQAYRSQISRNTHIYTLFPTNFYGNKKSPKDWQIPDGETVGIEIEMLFPSVEQKIRFSSWLGKNYEKWYCEYDGSLQDYGNAGENGLELISPPLLISDMLEKIGPICQKAIEFGGMGFPAGIFYGMHVTNKVPKSTRNANRDTIAARYICTINSPILRSFWQLVARRKGESFLTYCPFQNVNEDSCLITEQGRGMGNEAHRRAVFVRRKDLLETRIFRSNLNPRQVRANIEICHLTMLYCKSNDYNLEDPNYFYNFLEKNMSEDLRKILYRPKNTPMTELVRACMESKIRQQSVENYDN